MKFLDIIKNLFAFLFGDVSSYSLRHRLFNAYVFITIIFSIIATSINLAIGLEGHLVYNSVLMCLFCSCIYFISRKIKAYRYLIIPFLIAVMFIYVSQWFDNCGSMGGVQYIIFAAMIASVTLFKGRKKFVVILTYSLISAILFIVEYFSPELMNCYKSRVDRFVDVGFTYTAILIICGIASYVITKNYEETHDKYTEANMMLNQAYKEMKHDLKLAKVIQENILPEKNLHISGLDISALYLPLIEIGGDIYDIHSLPDGRVRIFLADATGHGITASLMTMLIKSEYEKIKTTIDDPSDVFDMLNRVFFKNYFSMNIFFTAVIIDYESQDNSFSYASAGHIDQYIAAGKTIKPISKTGRAIGISRTMNCETKKCSFNSGDKLLLFTDGLIEEFNSNREEFGEIRLQKLITANSDIPLNELLDIITEKIFSFIDTSEVNDDITIVAVKKSG